MNSGFCSGFCSGFFRFFDRKSLSCIGLASPYFYIPFFLLFKIQKQIAAPSRRKSKNKTARPFKLPREYSPPAAPTATGILRMRSLSACLLADKRLRAGRLASVAALHARSLLSAEPFGTHAFFQKN